MKKILKVACGMCLVAGLAVNGFALDRPERVKKEKEDMSKEFSWWPTDATPAPVKDEERGGLWWWPQKPGKVGPLWGNRGYVYVNKIIFDYKAEELPPPEPQEMRQSLIIKKIHRNVKIYFDYDSAEVRSDAEPILQDAVRVLKKNQETDILITGNCDIRGSEAYNEKLGRRRGQAVADYMVQNGVPEQRIRIVSRGKLDAVAPVTDIVGMQKDRNAQFMVAQVEEVMMPYQGGAQPQTSAVGRDMPDKIVLPDEGKAVKVDEGVFVLEKTEKTEGEVRVSTREYVVQKGDTLWEIAQKELGSGHRWKYLYEMNKERIANPNKLKAGTVILIPVE
ncbi:MAG: OmpA family protein [Candidatus Omnitrophica bacterium]|nr:OmpA family protein [Candidatus Omnitrophota bacterium]